MKFDSNPTKVIGVMVGILVILAAATPAVAQQAADGATDGAKTDTAGGSEANADPDDPMFWANKRDVYTVQKRPFQKQGRFSASVYGGIIPNNIFEQYYPAGVRLDYFVLENIGLELSGAYAFSNETGLRESVTSLNDDSNLLIGDTQVFHSNFGVVWSPFYGKTSFYNTALNYFDFYLFGGAGLVVTETPSDFNDDTPSKDYKPEGVLGAGLSFYFGDHVTLRADFRQFVFKKVIGGVANPSEVSLGVGWFF